MPWGEERRARTSAKKKKNTNCHATARRQVNDQAANEDVAMTNAANEDFAMHRRLMLAVAMKIDDREKGENITAVDEAGEADEEEEEHSSLINRM